MYFVYFVVVQMNFSALDEADDLLRPIGDIGDSHWGHLVRAALCHARDDSAGARSALSKAYEAAPGLDRGPAGQELKQVRTWISESRVLDFLDRHLVPLLNAH